MNNKYVFVAVMLSCILLVSAVLTSFYVRQSEGQEKLGQEETLIVTSFYPMYIAAENVVDGIDGITLSNLSEPQTGCLHDFQLTPADMKLLSKADVFVVNGGGIETFLSDVAKAYPKLKIVEACEGISMIHDEDEHIHEGHEYENDESMQEDHEHENDESMQEDHEYENDESMQESHEHEHHEHGEENAHAWMSIAAYREQVHNIENALEQELPQYAEHLRAKADIYDQKLKELQAQQEELLQLTEGTKVVLFHEAYAYVARDYGMNVSFVMDLDEERQVSAGEVAQVLSAIKEDGATLILAEERYAKDMAMTIQAEADVDVVYLDTLNRGTYDKDSYLTGMQENMNLLKTEIYSR